MSTTRPLTKAVLKKMFLKTLHEFTRPGGKFDGHAWGTDSVLHWMPTHFGLAPALSPEERADAIRAVYELERDGYIMQAPSQSSPTFKVLTAEGRAAVEQELDRMQLPSFNLNDLLSRDDLRGKVRDDFLAGEYETAVFKAFKLVEEAVRKRSGLSAEYGLGLMAGAFKKGGALRHPGAQSDAEAEGIHALFRGATGWFRNPTGHRTVEFADAHHVAHVLAFANLLLDLVDQCST